MKIFSPAKLNLYLRVLGKRPDGYHDLETLFERVSLRDEITLLPAASGISCVTSDPAVPSGPQNIAWRAADLLQKKYGVDRGVRIRIKKRIPANAGLGGGSSNAAAVLTGLNSLWKLSLTKRQLLQFASTLGSDVPFFVRDCSWALGHGRGERLKKIKGPKAKVWHCLVKPPFGISTKNAYEGLTTCALTPPWGDVKMLIHSLQKGDFSRLSGLLYNSLEVSLNKRVTIISKIKNELVREGAFASLLSGSGSTVFGIFKTRYQAQKAARALGKKNRKWRVFVASTY